MGGGLGMESSGLGDAPVESLRSLSEETGAEVAIRIESVKAKHPQLLYAPRSVAREAVCLRLDSWLLGGCFFFASPHGSCFFVFVLVL